MIATCPALRHTAALRLHMLRETVQGASQWTPELAAVVAAKNLRSVLAAGLDCLETPSHPGLKAHFKNFVAEVVMDAAPSWSRGTDEIRRCLHEHALLPTGLVSLDEMLGGGLAAGQVTELIGHAGAGKTQLCLLICAAQVAAADAGHALFLDTCGDYSASRVLAFTEALSRHGEPSLSREQCEARLGERVRYVPATELLQLLATLDQLDAELTCTVSEAGAAVSARAGCRGGSFGPCEWLRRLRLLVIDSAFSSFANAGGAVGSQTEVQLRRLLLRLRDLARRHNLAVLVTNTCSSGSGLGAPSAGACAERLKRPKPALGFAWHHTAETRLHVQAERAHDAGCTVHSLQLLKCPSVPFGKLPVAQTLHAGHAIHVQLGHDGQAA